MASDRDRKRGKGGDEAAGRRAKRPRLDEEGTSSEREMALHPSEDEDLFSLAALTREDNREETSDVSPAGYLSADGGSSFQLTKTEGEGAKKRTRKYRGATEEALEAERERERKERQRRERERKGEERQRYRGEEKERRNKSSSARSSPQREVSRGERERRLADDRHLYPPDERYYSRDRRGEGRRIGHEYSYDTRKGSADLGRWRRGREREDNYYQGHSRHSTSPRPGDYSRSDWRGPKKSLHERVPSGERQRGEWEREKVRYERERKHRKRKRSRDDHKEKREVERQEKYDSDNAERRGESDKIEDWIKELEEGEESEGRERDGEDSVSEEEGGRSSEEDVETKERRERRNDRSSVSDDGEGSEEGEIGEDKESSEGSEHSSPKLTSSVTEPILRSKFDDSSGSSGEEEEYRKPKTKSSVAFSQRRQGAYSGYAEVVSGSEQSEEESEKKDQANLETEGVKTDIETQEEKKEPEVEEEEEEDNMSHLPPYLPALMGCRNVEEYEWLNRIEEGTYGVVYRARDKRNGEIVALKKLKMEKEKEGFPITSLREINMLLKGKHPNVVFVKELVVGSNMDRIYIVMDYVEHDLKALMETMKQPFLEGEVKILLLQLLRAVHHLHDNWILHRDLKTSNLLLSHKGILKVGDFGLAREYGSPLRPYTPVVVTLWYRAPELLLGCKNYSTPIDMWSVGCIFAEFLQHKPLFMGKSEIDQLNQIFKELGTPSEEIWTGYNELPGVKKVTFTKQPYNNLRKRFPYLTQSGFELLNKFLTYDPKRRITAEKALEDQYFKESPLPVDPSMFPTWPAKSEKARRKSREKSPTPPIGGNYLLSQAEEDGFKITTALHGKAAVGAGFSLKF